MAGAPDEGKRPHQVLVNLDPDTYERLVRASKIQKHKHGQLAWILIQWALPYYDKARSVEALHALKLKQTGTDVPGTIDEKSYSRALQRQVLTDSKHTAQLEKVAGAKGQRSRSKPVNE